MEGCQPWIKQRWMVKNAGFNFATKLSCGLVVEVELAEKCNKFIIVNANFCDQKA